VWGTNFATRGVVTQKREAKRGHAQPWGDSKTVILSEESLIRSNTAGETIDARKEEST